MPVSLNSTVSRPSPSSDHVCTVCHLRPSGYVVSLVTVNWLPPHAAFESATISSPQLGDCHGISSANASVTSDVRVVRTRR
jgi:hypothetical protein